MAISTPEQRINHIRGLREAAEKMLREQQECQANDKDIEFRFGAPAGK